MNEDKCGIFCRLRCNYKYMHGFNHLVWLILGVAATIGVLVVIL